MAPLNLITEAIAYNIKAEAELIEAEIRDVENLSLSYNDAIYAIGKLEIPSKLFILVYKSTLHTVHKRQLLYLAARDGKLNIIKQLNNSGLPIHDRDLDFAGEWALSCAIIGGQLKVVQYLVDDGADLLDNYCKAMVLACCNGKLDIVKYIYETTHVFYDAQGISPLLAACKSGHLEIVKYIHENSNNPYVENILMPDIKSMLIYNAIMCGHLEVLEFLHQNGCYYERSVSTNFMSRNTYNAHFQYLLSTICNYNYYGVHEFLTSHYDEYGNLL